MEMMNRHEAQRQKFKDTMKKHEAQRQFNLKNDL